MKDNTFLACNHISTNLWANQFSVACGVKILEPGATIIVLYRQGNEYFCLTHLGLGWIHHSAPSPIEF